jgi:uracil-DNA glycosylase family 4
VFTGDGAGGSGDFLMSALHQTGFASMPTSQRADDGLQLRDTYISMAVRCAPPANKPTPEEVLRCQPHLDAEAGALAHVRVVVALGKIAFDAWLQRMKRLGVSVTPRPPFAHGSVARVEGAPILMGCYHPSRQNTNTGKLTPTMMRAVFEKARRLIEAE